jgi:hypothetical protein
MSRAGMWIEQRRRRTSPPSESGREECRATRSHPIQSDVTPDVCAQLRDRRRAPPPAIAFDAEACGGTNDRRQLGDRPASVRPDEAARFMEGHLLPPVSPGRLRSGAEKRPDPDASPTGRAGCDAPALSVRSVSSDLAGETWRERFAPRIGRLIRRPLEMPNTGALCAFAPSAHEIGHAPLLPLLKERRG